MIINIRGTSGTGKSTLVEKLFKKHGVITKNYDYVLGKRDILKPTTKKKVVGYTLHPKGTIHVVGRYETKCGGCDTIKTQDQVMSLVREAARIHPFVVFEGLLTCNSYGRWKELADEQPFTFLFLDTSIEICLEAVVKRRIERGKTPSEAVADERTIYNLTRMYNTNQKTFAKCQNDNQLCHMVDRDEAWTVLQKLVTGEMDALNQGS
jgi:uridine kinase